MPRIDTLLDRLGGARYTTKLDMIEAYFQVPLAPQDGSLTGFVTRQGHFQWRFMAFGLSNAAATLSRVVTKVFKGLEEFYEAYLNCVLVFSKSWLNHINHLEIVFERIRLANPHAKLEKMRVC